MKSFETSPAASAGRALASNRAPSFWMPFTPMRQYPEHRMRFVGAEGMHYRDESGREILDAMAGLWCVNAGHNQPGITEAIREMASRLDFVSCFRMEHPWAEQLADALTASAPAGIEHAFFVNSGSEAVDTALKIARAYHQARGEGRRTKFIGRAKGYHGMGWGGLSVSGIGRHKRDFGPLLGDVAHLPLPYDRGMTFSRGQPKEGASYADALEQLVATLDPMTVAAVIVEPVTGSGGVYPPPLGYLERLRAICDRHGILLIFDEVITGFGRLGANFATEAYGVIPDLMACAKGLTNGAVPMGAVLARDTVYEAFMAGPSDVIELMHGYTYSAHPLACAAGLATLAAHRELGIPAHARQMSPVWEEAAHGLKTSPHVVDIRTAGILAAIDLAPRAGAPGARGLECHYACFEDGVLVRNSGDTLVLSPPLILSEGDIGRVFSTIAHALERIG